MPLGRFVTLAGGLVQPVLGLQGVAHKALAAGIQAGQPVLRLVVAAQRRLAVAQGGLHGVGRRPQPTLMQMPQMKQALAVAALGQHGKDTKGSAMAPALMRHLPQPAGQLMGPPGTPLPPPLPKTRQNNHIVNLF